MKPAIATTVSSAPPQNGHESGAAHAPTILVVDDSTTYRKLTCDALGAKGFAIVEADDGTSALAMVHRHKIDLIVLDNEMQHMGGLTFLKTLRANPAWARLQVIVLTSTPSREVAAQVIKCGVRGYFLKSKSSLVELTARAVELLGSPCACPSDGPKQGVRDCPL